MISFHNIKAVAKYESILLGRSWFFRIFALLSIIPLGIYNYILINQWRPWIMEAIPTNIPLINMLILNVGQAIIAIFLASDFIKRDQKLDTSEVFFVKAMSNTEYVIGKTWGSFRMFLLLNFVALGISLLHNSVVDHSWIDWSAYLFYFLFISVPTLIFIIGLSYFLMILLKNQAVVFALLLGYVALTIFYIGNELYYVFNYMGFELPIVKSDIVGFPHIVSLIIQRMIYLLLGLGFITLTIVKFNRLPNKNSGRRIVSVVSVFMFAGAILLSYTHISDVFKVRNKRVEYVALNDKYVSADKIVPESCEITVEQQTKGIKADAVINGYAERSGEEFIFTLNPGLKLIDVTAKDRELSFEREKQIIIVKFAEPLRRRENVSLTFTYEGDVDQNFCYLDVDNKTYEKRESKNGFVIENQYAFSTPDYLMYTPETYWYPRPGTSYAPSDSRWLQSPFQSFNLEVTPRDSLVAISQGIETIEDGRYIFKSENPLQAISLVIGNYEKLSENIDGIDYSLYYYKKHDFFTSVMDSLQDTIPFMISDLKQDLERDRNLTYPFNRLSLVEVPANFSSFSRLWTKAQETVQPEMIFIPERGYAIDAADINWSIRMAQNNQRAGGGGPMGGPGGRGGRGGNQTRTLYDFKYDALNSFFRSFLNQQLRPQWSMAAGGNANISVSEIGRAHV